MTAAAFSKATWIQGTFQFVKGNGEETISMQPVALPTMTFEPSAFATSLTASASAQPWHARCPGAKYSRFVTSLDA